MNKFQVGDVVEAFGLRGKVTNIGENGRVYVLYDSNYLDSFFSDGKLWDWHLEPSLKLIKRPKKKVTKTRTVWVNLYKSGEVYAWHTKEYANDYTDRANDYVETREITYSWEEEV